MRPSAEITGIAIIGMACRFPGAENPTTFWSNLCNGVESVSFFSDEELLASGLESSLLQNPDYVKASPILRDVDKFDASFFGYSPKEASLIDPQHRLFLEVAWEAFEDAGIIPDLKTVLPVFLPGRAESLRAISWLTKVIPCYQGKLRGCRISAMIKTSSAPTYLTS
jgi:Beta-ketoacyl synthase, N-terminal domain